jgi:hypothetical protein
MFHNIIFYSFFPPFFLIDQELIVQMLTDICHSNHDEIFRAHM